MNEDPVSIYGAAASIDPTNSSYPESGSGSKNDTGTFANLGISQETPLVGTYVGKRRRISNITRKEIAFAVVSLIAILTSTGLTIERLAILKPCSSDFTFAIVLLITLVFCLIYILNGINGEIAVEIGVFVGGTFLLMLYCIFNYALTTDSISTHEKNIKLARLIIIVFFGPICIVLGAIIAREYYLSKDLIFRTVGANVELQNLCRKIFTTKAFMKVDLQLKLSLVVLMVKHGFCSMAPVEIAVLSVSVFFTCAWLVVAFMTIPYENKRWTMSVLLTSVGEPAYIIYQLVRMGESWNTFSGNMMIPAAIILTCILGLVVRIVLCSFIIYIYRNYDADMKKKAYGVLRLERTVGNDIYIN